MMKKLRILIQYECMTSFKYIWLFYAIMYAIVLLIYIMVSAITGGSGDRRHQLSGDEHLYLCGYSRCIRVQ